MPQLNPTPWLFYLLLVWIIFLSLAPSKILNHINLNDFGHKNMKTEHPLWFWPW